MRQDGEVKEIKRHTTHKRTVISVYIRGIYYKDRKH